MLSPSGQWRAVRDSHVRDRPGTGALALMLNHPNDSRTREELARALDDLARLAREGIPGCGSASVTVLHEGDAQTMSSSDDRALAIDEEQYAGESGPCLSAMRERQIVDVPDYTTE